MKLKYFLGVFLVVVLLFVSNYNIAFGAVAPAVTSGVLQNTTSTSVDMYLTGTSFNSFAHNYSGTQILVADSTDLANITYNGINPVSATITEDGTTKHLTATFNFSDGASTAKSGGSLTIAANTIRNASTLNALITLNDANITDSASPNLVEVTPVATPTTDYTPSYTFSSTEAGTLSYSGACSSGDTSGASGNNTITFNALAVGSYSNCVVTVTDTNTNAGNLSVTAFTINEGSYTGEYWNFGTGVSPAFDFSAEPDYLATDSSITFNWGMGSPNGAISGDHFIARWTKTQYLAQGTYNFDVSYLDDGARVYVDNVLIIGSWIDQGGGNYAASLELSAGEHDIRVEYYENGGAASINFSYGIITAPVLSVVTPVPTPTSNASVINFTFNSDQNGSITYGGSCTSDTTSASVGDNTIIFTSSTAGTYSDCTITVTNSGGLASLPLAVPEFTIVDAPTTVYVDDDYNSLGTNGGHTWGSNAFDNVEDAYQAVAPQGTINIYGGTYATGNTIFLQKAVTIVGPGIESEDSALVVNNSCSYVFSIETSNVSMTGLFIKQTETDNSTYCYSYPAIRVINSDNGVTTGTTITYNDISGGYRGVQLRGDSSGANISHNKFHDNTVGMNISSSKHNDISNNEIYNNQRYGVYFWSGECNQYCDGNPSDNNISGNQIYGNGFSDSGSGVYMDNGSGNLFYENYIYGNYKHGISIHVGNVSNGSKNIIQKNYIYENGLTADTNGAGPSGIEVQSSYVKIFDNIISANARNGIQLGYNGGGYDHITITGNYIGTGTINSTLYSGNTERGIYIRGGNNFEIHNNSIAGNQQYGIFNETTDDVDATSNWWGSASGPTHETNPTGSGDTITDHVLYDPYLASADLKNQYYVDDDYTSEGENEGHTWGVDAFSDVFTAVSHATANSTIHVGPGTYVSSQTLEINTPVSIIGPGKDSETPAVVVNNSCNHTLSIQASGTSISGLIIKQTENDGETICTSYPVIRVASNNIYNQQTATEVTNVTINDNEIVGGYRGIVLRGDSNHTTVTNNKIHLGRGGILISSSKYNTISVNTVYDIDGSGILFYGGGCSNYYCDDRPSHNTVSQNTIRNNSVNGIEVSATHAHNNTFDQNNIYENGKHGIKIYVYDELSAGEKNTISNNNIYGNGTDLNAGSQGHGPSGLEIQADYTEITGNTIAFNRRNGIQIGGDMGDIDNITITGNTIGQATISGVSYEGNTERGIYIQNGNNAQIHENNISGNGDIGVYNISGNIADATNNWWGSTSGPYQANSNPTGQGDEVSENVLYDPYAIAVFSAENFPPAVTTNQASSVSLNSATLNGSIASTGSTDVTVRGFNYGLSQSYGSDSSSTGNFALGTFDINIGGLSCATTYHFRAYATNSQGTTYGNDETFTTSGCPGAVSVAFLSLVSGANNNSNNSNSNNTNTNNTGDNNSNSSQNSQINKVGLPENFSFGKNIKPSSKNLDVKMLQIFLNNNNFPVSENGAGSKGKENNFFGKNTKNALKKFQETYAKEILYPQGLKKGNGILGPATRKFINELLKNAKN